MAWTVKTAISGHRAATGRPMPDRPIQRAIGSGLAGMRVTPGSGASDGAALTTGTVAIPPRPRDVLAASLTVIAPTP